MLGSCEWGGLSYFAHAGGLRLRSAGAHFVRRPVGLASARSVPRRAIITAVIPVKMGIQCQQVRCMPRSVDSRFRGNDKGISGGSGTENGLSEAKKAVRPNRMRSR
jgi:hypothetical protein